MRDVALEMKQAIPNMPQDIIATGENTAIGMSIVEFASRPMARLALYRLFDDEEEYKQVQLGVLLHGGQILAAISFLRTAYQQLSPVRHRTVGVAYGPEVGTVSCSFGDKYKVSVSPWDFLSRRQGPVAWIRRTRDDQVTDAFPIEVDRIDEVIEVLRQAKAHAEGHTND